MRNLINQEFNTVSGATIMNELPFGTFIRGITTQIVDPSTAQVQTILLCAWKPDVKQNWLSLVSNNTPFFYNEKYLSGMPNVDVGIFEPNWNWTGYSW